MKDSQTAFVNGRVFSRDLDIHAVVMSKRCNARRWPSLALLTLLTICIIGATTATTTTTLECNATAAGQAAIERWSLLSELTFSRDCTSNTTLQQYIFGT